VERGDETAAQSRINCSLPYQLLLARKLVRDIRRAMRKHHSAEGNIRIVMEGLGSEELIENIEKLGPESFALSVPFPTPPPLTQTCSQPWVGFEIPEYLRAFRQKP
jgi:hypothetical protein